MSSSDFFPMTHQQIRVPFPVLEDPAQTQPIPESHFLNNAGTVVLPANEDGALPDTSTLAAADFDVSVTTGFLPATVVPRLDLPVWEKYESLLEAAQAEAKALGLDAVGRLSADIRSRFGCLPAPDVTLLTTLPLLRRAHVLLSFIGHFCVHATFPANPNLPENLAAPWVAVSTSLGLPPILTYADTVLWNWRLIDPTCPLSAENVEIISTFTDSPTEKAFYMLSLLSELYGARLLALMRSAMDELFFADTLAMRRIARKLERMRRYIGEMEALLVGAVKGGFGPNAAHVIDPDVFYWQVRPWFNGGTWTYGTEVRTLGGPSAGQSSLIHSIDLFLGVDHSPRGNPTDASSARPARSSSTQDSPPSSDETFMTRMAYYMPRFHRDFLAHLKTLSQGDADTPSIRQLALNHPELLRDAFNGAVGAMKSFRDKHMILTTFFIMQPARHEPSRDNVFWQDWYDKQKDTAAAKEIKGTGGTALVSFLKTCRERTVEAKIEQ